jgi:hypothetical protein
MQSVRTVVSQTRLQTVCKGAVAHARSDGPTLLGGRNAQSFSRIDW